MGSGTEPNDRKSFKPKKVRREIMKYLLQKYGDLRTKEIAKVLGLSERTIRRTLKKLEDMGEAEKVKVGKSYVWKLVQDESERPMYF